MSDLWLTIRSGSNAFHCWNVGEQPDDERLQDIIMRARVLTGFPVGDDWALTPHTTTIQLAPGEPHPSMLARATVHPLSELDAVDPAALAVYRAQCAEASRTSRMAAARRAMTALPDADRRQIAAEYSGTPRPTTGRP